MNKRRWRTMMMMMTVMMMMIFRTKARTRSSYDVTVIFFLLCIAECCGSAWILHILTTLAVVL